MAQYDLNDWASRLISLLPSEWFSSTAITGGGVLYSVAQGIVSNFPFHTMQASYQTLQTRISTATDTNLDQISTDFFGITLPRLPGESDTSFRARIKAAIVAPKSTIAAIQNAVDFYYANIYVIPAGVLSLDTGGALDTWGSLDMTGGGIIDLPTATIWDQMTDPTDASIYGITPTQFVVEAVFPIRKGTGWALTYTPITYSACFVFISLMPFPGVVDPNLEQIVTEYKAEGCIPVYRYHRSLST